LNLYTITLRCHITGKESDYKVSFPSEEALGQYFAVTRDRLIAVGDGWGELGLWGMDLLGARMAQLKPPFDGKWTEPEHYDSMVDDLL
jgi:hypothetical protein